MLRPLGIALVLIPNILGVEFPHGQMVFDQPPVCVEVVLEAHTHYPQVWLRNTTYNFVVRIPTTAGDPLARLEIQQPPGIETIYWLPQRLCAFMGDRALGQNIATGGLQFYRNSNFLLT
ncbi:hypothetical protein NK55_09270 [Thermosynechococcus sp. NK55a]|uniref:DUF2808 domain-containing protein n=1 Tax=Thermosynechococcus sp. NK55a TaxID=1394889 RepID=UPI0003D8530C|nr:DUF2808 domain-containing protein [Thermosynechococcus sp. NK55a]AHB89112.1 hypothetical protein NK55_09270 [Thermosynechococcus sp. NK55a]